MCCLDIKNLEGVEYMCQEMEKIYSEGIEIGEKNGELKKAKETALSLAEMGFPIEKIAKAININVNDVQKWIEKEPGVRHQKLQIKFL